MLPAENTSRWFHVQADFAIRGRVRVVFWVRVRVKIQGSGSGSVRVRVWGRVNFVLPAQDRRFTLLIRFTCILHRTFSARTKAFIPRARFKFQTCRASTTLKSWTQLWCFLLKPCKSKNAVLRKIVLKCSVLWRRSAFAISINLA